MKMTHHLAILAALSCHVAGQVLPLNRRAAPSSAVLKVAGADYYNLFDTEVTIGNQTFLVQVDTGSGDLWVLQQGWQCINSTSNQIIAQSECTFGNASYTPSPTLQIIDGEYFGVVYGAGDAQGALAYEDVVLGGIKVERQIIGLVNSTADTGSGIDEGVLGLGYPVLTMAQSDANTDNSSESLLLNRITYDNIFTRMWKQGLVEPWFSMALLRPVDDAEVNGNGGFLALGELPPVPYDGDSWAVKPVEISNAVPAEFTNGTTEITEWTLSVDGVFWAPPAADNQTTTAGPGTPGLASNTTAFQAVVDSGQPLNLIPEQILDEIHALFDPPVSYDEDSELYVADCDAQPARVGFQLDNRVFWLEAADLIMPVEEGVCMSTLYPTANSALGVSFNFLGDAFLRNVVAVFDFGKNEMRFAGRADGGGVTTVTSTPGPDSGPDPDAL